MLCVVEIVGFICDEVGMKIVVVSSEGVVSSECVVLSGVSSEVVVSSGVVSSECVVLSVGISTRFTDEDIFPVSFLMPNSYLSICEIV